MPFCNEHNEVYRDEECPKCAGKDDSDDINTVTGHSTDEVDDIVRDAIESATQDLDIDETSGDVVVGSQEKSHNQTDVTDIDQSTTRIDKSKEVNDESTTVEDSVVQGSDIGGEGNAEVRDSVVKDSNIAGSTSDRGGGRKLSGESTEQEKPDRPGELQPTEGQRRTQPNNRQQTADEQPSPVSKKRPQSSGDSQSGREFKETKFCLYCGAEIPERASQCPDCGEDLEV